MINMWNSLKFNASNAAVQAASGLTLQWRQGNTGSLIYKNQHYKSVLVHVARLAVIQTVEGELKKILPRFKKHIADVERKKILEQQKKDVAELIKNREIPEKKWGTIMAEGGHEVIAQDKYGNMVKESLIIYFDDTEPHEVKESTDLRIDGKLTMNPTITYSTKTLFHIDLAPQVSQSSTKNIVMTQVQGRDYTRKELVSGGDLTFTVRGNIVSNEPYTYPDNLVKKFIKIMQYNGIINVNNMIFEQFGISKIIVKDFNLETPTYKNIQPYSFTCVAVEPNDAIQIGKDTISVLNYQLKKSPVESMFNKVLQEKMEAIAANTITNLGTSSIASLIPNI